MVRTLQLQPFKISSMNHKPVPHLCSFWKCWVRDFETIIVSTSEFLMKILKMTRTAVWYVTIPRRMLIQHASGPQASACSLVLCIYYNKVIYQIACQKNTHECEYYTHTRVKITRMNVKITRMSVKMARMVLKSHAWCAKSHSWTQSGFFWKSYVDFSWFILKSHASCWNLTHVWLVNSQCVRKIPSACINHTLRMAIALCE
jgi:hypothetical protein